MKTKFLKFGMPLMVFMLAIVFAFANETNAVESEALTIPGYIFENQQCKPARSCNNEGSLPCLQSGVQVYMTNLGGTSCIVELTDRP
jgi:hypothetical protein